MHLLTGCVVSFAELVDTVVTNLREIAPLGFLGVPRIWEKMQQSVQYRIKDARPLQRYVFETCMRLGAPIAERRLRNGGRSKASVTASPSSCCGSPAIAACNASSG